MKTVRTISHADGKRRVHIVDRGDGTYGYLFGLGPEERVASWWVGFERKDGTTRLVAYKDKKSAGCDSLPLEADAAAELIVGASSER